MLRQTNDYFHNYIATLTGEYDSSSFDSVICGQILMFCYDFVSYIKLYICYFIVGNTLMNIIVVSFSWRGAGGLYIIFFWETNQS